MDINYELYKVFYHVASTLSFSEASKQLFISQSAVSQSIKVLEKKLNQTLFIRSTKKVQLTPEGEILLKHVEPAMNLIRQGENQLLDSNSLNGGQLRIGASDTICRYYLVPFLSEFHKRYPNIHIKVTNRTSIECARLLDNGQVDFILTNYPNSGLGGTQNIHVLREFNDIFVANETYFPMKDRLHCASCRRSQSSCWIARVPPANFCTTCSRSTSSTSYRRLN
jgi:DNA-binding transcriptional LysR family regulator